MAIIGITGGIGAGKSIVSRILRLRGFQVYDCDSEAKHLMDTNRDLIVKIQARFGDKCVNSDGSLNRAEISKIVFSSKEELAWLNSQVHHLVKEDIISLVSNPEGVKFVESAILKSSGLDELCDLIWIVDAPEEIRVERAIGRGGIEMENLLRRIETQRMELASIDLSKVRIIKNYGSNSVLEQINIFLEEISL